MNPVAVLPVAMGAVAVFVGFWHLLVYFRGIREREHLYFALTCLGVGFYDVGAGVSYVGGDLFVAGLGQRLQHVALAIIGPALLWFVLTYTRHELRWPARILTAYGVLQGLAVLTLWNDWVLKPSRRITTVHLPWGATVVYDEAQHGVLLKVASVVYLITILIMLVLTARYLWRATEKDRPRAARLALGIGLFLAGALNDLAVANNVYAFVYLIEYAYGAMVLVMTFGLSSGVIELASTRSELRHSLARLQRIFDSVEEVYVETALDGTILEISPSASFWVGSDRDLRGRPSLDFYADPADREHLLAALAKDGRVRDFESTVRLPDGRLVPYAGNFSLVRDEETGQARIVGSLRDITEQKRAEDERRRLEEKMLQAQKLESLGVLAGGFAHDFNNLLTGILGSAELATNDLEPGHQARPRIELIRESGRQATALCRQMLAYSGRTAFDLAPLNLSRLVSEMSELLRASVSRRVALEYDLAAGLPDVVADPAQLRQIVLNLAINASEAIGDAAGTITLRTRLEHCSHADLDSRYLAAPLPDGDYVRLEVTDTGSGMDEQTRARLFDPFFTTKFSGRGLGLAAVLGIVRGHRGTIQVESQTGSGSTFRVLLPAREGAASERVAPTSQAGWRGRGRVLLVDDEAQVREVGRDMLRHLGFEVSVADGGHAAIEAILASTDAFVLAIVDLTMPDLDGIEVARRLLVIRPDLPVLLTSGYTEEESTARLDGAGVRGFVAKPFSLEDLREKLQVALH